MNGASVQVYLRTPLYRGHYRRTTDTVPEHRYARAAADVMEIEGTVLAERRTGLHLQVRALRDEQGNLIAPCAFDEIVVPPSKIDHVVLLSGGEPDATPGGTRGSRRRNDEPSG